MGREIDCRARIGRKWTSGRALLESDALLFRGETRLEIPFREIRSLEAGGGELTVTWSEGQVAFELGEHASDWAQRIKNPKSVLDKLGVRPGTRVAVLGLDEPGFERDLTARKADVARVRPRRDTELVFLGAVSPAGLSRLAGLAASIHPEAGIWVVWPKGKPDLREDDIREAGRRAGLVDVKVVSFSETMSALKLVIPVALRGGREASSRLRKGSAKRESAARGRARK